MFFIDDENFTKYGYYSINGAKTLSRFEAYQLAGHDKSKIEFNFNDSELSNYDWTVEPTQDIYQLYAERAKQLRNNYDYIIVMYSGGIDSHIILNSFVENNIHIDEICTVSTADCDVKSSKFNQEVFNKAIPYVQTLNLKHTKFRYLEIGKAVVDQWSDEYHFENFHYYNVGAQWASVLRSHKFKELIPEHIDLAQRGKKVCYVWGLDKPNLFLQEGNYCFKYIDNFIDFGARQFVNRVQFKEKFFNCYDELFYISKDMPEITIKQCHLLSQFLKTISKTDYRLQDYNDLANTGPFVVHHKSSIPYQDGDYSNYKFLNRSAICKCIYPNEQIELFGDDKVKGSIIFSKKDLWFSGSNHDNRFRYEQKMLGLISQYKNCYGFKNGVPVQLSSIHSKPYIITNALNYE